jgi:hypothetical protein
MVNSDGRGPMAQGHILKVVLAKLSVAFVSGEAAIGSFSGLLTGIKILAIILSTIVSVKRCESRLRSKQWTYVCMVFAASTVHGPELSSRAISACVNTRDEGEGEC